jgi:hypothetical protein
MECDKERCDSGLCIPKLGSCMACDEDSDCAGQDGKCLLFKCCSNEQGLMNNNCFCRVGSDCDSGRCEGFANYCALSYVCEIKKGGILGSASPNAPWQAQRDQSFLRTMLPISGAVLAPMTLGTQ